MLKNYTLGQRCMAYILLVGFMLQSCNKLSIPTEQLDTEEKQYSVSSDKLEKEPFEYEETLATSKELMVLEILPSNFAEGSSVRSLNLEEIDNSADKLLDVTLDWTSRQGHIVHQLYRREDGLHARVVDKASSKIVYDLPVYIFPGSSLAQIAIYPKKKLSHYIHITQPAKSGRKGAVILSQGGLQGGGQINTKSKPKNKHQIAQYNLGDLNKIPRDILKLIFSYAGSKGMRQVRKLNKSFYQFTTGYGSPGIVGVKYKPQANMLAGGLAINKRILDFRVVKGIMPESIPSYVWYHLVGEAHNISQAFWPYIQSTQVHTLYLKSNQIGDAGAIELAKYLPETNLHTIDLSNNEIGDAGAIELAKHLKGTQVQKLNLGSNKIGSAGAIELIKNLPGTNIQILDLYSNQIGDAGAIELAKYLKGTQVQKLNLGSNKIGDAGAIELAKHLAGTQVQTLKLGFNQIRAEGACELVKLLQSTHVHTIDLSGNKIGDAGAIELAKHLQRTNLQKIYLGSNRIRAAGAIELAKLLQGTNVQKLNLYGDSIGAETQQTLKEQYPPIEWRFPVFYWTSL
jgi:Leucine-rich repeat (LRR) protein